MSKNKDWLAQNEDDDATCTYVDCCVSSLTLYTKPICHVQNSYHHN